MSGGIQQISVAAKDTSWEALRVGLVAPQDGYVQVWVANESNTNVFFDDISVSATSRYLVEELHYNPWGLELEGLTYICEVVRRVVLLLSWSFVGVSFVVKTGKYPNDIFIFVDNKIQGGVRKLFYF